MFSDLSLQDFLTNRGMDLQVKQGAETFLRERFNANPKYSFNNADIMIDHSIDVMNIAIELSKDYPQADITVILLGALFHDIGKTANEAPEVLKAQHAQFNWDIANKFLSTLGLTAVQLEKLKNILFENPETINSCIEQKIVKEADKVAFVTDDGLQTAFYSWAEGLVVGNGKVELQRKLDKVKTLELPRAKEIVGKYSEIMRSKWKLV